MHETRSRSIFEFDIILFLSVVLLTIVGILFIYSSGVTSTGIVFSTEYIRQIIWAAIGLVLMIAVAFTDYRVYREAAVYLFLVMLLLLVITLLFGRVVNGARRWLGLWEFGIQPSEFAKLALILVVAKYLDHVKDGIRRLPTFILGMLLVVPPTLLVLVQPDLGTAVVYLPLYLIMAFVAGAKAAHVGFFVLTGMSVLIFTLLPTYEQFVLERHSPLISVLREPGPVSILLGTLVLVVVLAIVGRIVTKRRWFSAIAYGTSIPAVGVAASIFVRGFLRPYQLMRLVVFLDPSIDPRGAGWNTIQSVTAVGSGGVWGKGYLQGTQSHFQYLPQQSTDFIFSIIAEEWGFVGAFGIFVLFFLILLRAVLILGYAKDSFGAYLAAGVAGLIFTHFVVNIGMAMGILPITGLPLFFLSYGGSPLWTGMIGIGLLLSVYNRKYR
ncbi:MAG: rod shape-determining protein RodA [Spirochaetaceae bacterium]|nr:MAG: rod shape-determining protein RodA [Spirochaetaceae bacterium]